MNAPVQKLWIFELPWKMQTVVNQALRAPDTHFAPKIKIVCRWMRSVCLNNADNNHSFMCRKNKLPTWEELENEINYCSVHFATHFLYGLEIIAYKHPDKDVKSIALNYYENIVTCSMHLNIESEYHINLRLSDLEEVPKFESLIKSKEAVPQICPPNDRYIRR